MDDAQNLMEEFDVKEGQNIDFETFKKMFDQPDDMSDFEYDESMVADEGSPRTGFNIPISLEKKFTTFLGN
jgi:hypothetical protein